MPMSSQQTLHSPGIAMPLIPGLSAFGGDDPPSPLEAPDAMQNIGGDDPPSPLEAPDSIQNFGGDDPPSPLEAPDTPR